MPAGEAVFEMDLSGYRLTKMAEPGTKAQRKNFGWPHRDHLHPAWLSSFYRG